MMFKVFKIKWVFLLVLTLFSEKSFAETYQDVKENHYYVEINDQSEKTFPTNTAQDVKDFLKNKTVVLFKDKRNNMIIVDQKSIYSHKSEIFFLASHKFSIFEETSQPRANFDIKIEVRLLETNDDNRIVAIRFFKYVLEDQKLVKKSYFNPGKFRFKKNLPPQKLIEEISKLIIRLTFK